MRTLPAFAALLAISALSPAPAQSYPDGGRTLIDPATGQPRYVPPLIEPWQSQPVRLHPARKRAAHHESAATATPETTSNTYASTAPESAPPAPKPHKTKRTATAAAAPQQAAPAAQPAAPAQQAAGTFSGGTDFTDLISPQQATPATPARKKVAATPPPKPVERAKPVETPRVSEPPPAPPPAEKPVQKASIEPSKPAKSRASTGARKDSIPFAPNASDPSTTAVSTVRSLAGTLNGALSNSNARVQLMAYGGMRGEKSSDTRRLSLKRALVIRQLLIDDGVPAERIDVFALGGVDDDGPLDRVDIFVKS